MVRVSRVVLSLSAIVALVEAAPLPQPYILPSSDEYKTKPAFPIFSDNGHNDIVTGETSASQEDAVVDHAPVDLQPKEETTGQAKTSPAVEPITFSSPHKHQSENPQVEAAPSTSGETDEPEKPKEKKTWTTKHSIGAAVASVVTGLACLAVVCSATGSKGAGAIAPTRGTHSGVAISGSMTSAGTGVSTSLGQHDLLLGDFDGHEEEN